VLNFQKSLKNFKRMCPFHKEKVAFLVNLAKKQVTDNQCIVNNMEIDYVNN
jgi:hypothetical protein